MITEIFDKQEDINTHFAVCGSLFSSQWSLINRHGNWSAAERIIPDPTETAAQIWCDTARTAHTIMVITDKAIAIFLKTFFSFCVSLLPSESMGLNMAIWIAARNRSKAHQLWASALSTKRTPSRKTVSTAVETMPQSTDD